MQLDQWLKHKVTCSMLVCLLWSCSSIEQITNVEQTTGDQELRNAKLSAIKHGTTISQTSQKPQLIKVPKEAPWLNQNIDVTYTGGIDAKTAIISILQNQPLRFEVSTNGPLVKANPKARTFKQHLDSISEQANWSYRVSNGVVTISDWQVINYPIYFLLGQKKINLTPGSMVSNTEGRSSSQASAQTNTLSISSDGLKELKEIMDKLISKSKVEESSNKKPTYSIIKTTNSMLVSAPPNIQKKVKNALSTINAIAGRTIFLAFDIYSVELFETYQKAIDIEVLKKTGVSVSSKATSGILGNSSPYVLSIDSNKSQYDSNIMLRALANTGKASLVNKGTLLLKNNEAGDIRTTSLNRWEEIAPSDDFKSKSPAFKESIIQVLPSIIDNKINLHMIISNTDNEPYLKSLKRELVTQTTGVSSNVPQYQIQAEIGMIKLGEQFVIPTEVNNGETLIIGGLSRKTLSDNQSKNQMLPIFGNGRDKQQRRRETIIVLSAYLYD